MTAEPLNPQRFDSVLDRGTDIASPRPRQGRVKAAPRPRQGRAKVLHGKNGLPTPPKGPPRAHIGATGRHSCRFLKLYCSTCDFYEFFLEF